MSEQNRENQYFMQRSPDSDLVLNTREVIDSDFLLDSYDSSVSHLTQSATMVKKENLVKG